MKAGILVTGAIAGLIGLGTIRSADAADDIKIGMAVAFSGWMEAYDGEATKMAELWVAQQNAKGGLLGKHIDVITQDTKTDRVEGAKAGKAMIDGGAQLLLVSADYDYGAPAALQAQKAGVVSFFLGASDPKAGVIGVGPYSFTANNAAQLEGAVMADWGYDKKNFRKGYMLVDTTIEYNKSICAGYNWMFPLKGGTVVGQDEFQGLDPTISSQITRLSDAIRTQQVDNVMLCSTNPGAASAVRQLRAAGINIPIMSGTAMDGTYWLNSTPGLKDFYLPVQALTVSDPNPDVDALTAAYTKMYGKPPTTQYAYPIYATLQLWAEAVTQAGTTDAAKVVAIMNKDTAAPTILGPRTFTPMLHIQTNIPMTVVSYADGKETPVEQVTITQPIPMNVLYRLKQ